MHTFVSSDGYRIHHNGDYSGDVVIQDEGKGKSMDVSARALIEFVAQYVANERISLLEDATPEAVFGISHEAPDAHE